MVPSEITLDTISAKNDGGATIAVAVASRLMLSRVSNIKNPNGSYKIELRSADIDVCAVLN